MMHRNEPAGLSSQPVQLTACQVQVPEDKRYINRNNIAVRSRSATMSTLPLKVREVLAHAKPS